MIEGGGAQCTPSNRCTRGTGAAIDSAKSTGVTHAELASGRLGLTVGNSMYMDTRKKWTGWDHGRLGPVGENGVYMYTKEKGAYMV